MFESQRRTPPVWKWFIAYSIFMALLYLACLIGVVGFFFFYYSSARTSFDQGFAVGFALVFATLSFILLAIYAAAPFVPKRPWAWTYTLVLICIGLTSPLLLPACIPLLIYWLKPETKAFFGKK